MRGIPGAEGSILRYPVERDGICPALSVFKHYGLGKVRILGVLVVLALAIKTYDHVRVLLYGAGFSQIGEHRPFILPAFACTREL